VSERRLHLLRHGATALTGRLVGRSDPPVTAEGLEACKLKVTGMAFDRVHTSDLLRARSCAEAIGPATCDPRWRELDFGAWDGLAPAEIDGDALGRFWADPDAAPPPCGERWSALTARVGAALADIPAGETLVVTHGGAMRAALACLFGFDQRALWAFDLPCAALLSLRLWPDGAQIMGLR
jgi:alpha-ribazole phosphatase